jgi:ubiquinone/menaquinone biosynthesis C-methylase UbiE
MKTRADYSEVELRTKQIYVEQHKNFLSDDSIFQRHLAAAQNTDTYDLPREFFKGKTILDAGCGNSGYFEVAMYNLGAKNVTCLDIGEEWKAEMDKVLFKHKIPAGFCRYQSGSTTEIPFQDGTFDFAVSYGVLMHLETVEMASTAVSELSRVTRRPGAVYAHIGIDKPGIVDRYIVKALRAAYQEDPEFKAFIDNIDPDAINSELARIYRSCHEHDPRLREVPDSLFSNLITLDSATFWQNMLQVPVQQGPALSEEWGRSEMARNGLVNIRRPKGTYWLRNDFRRFLAPLHFSLGSPLASLFYGNGHVKLTAEKPGKA